MKKYKSEAMQVIYEDAEHFYKEGLMSEEDFHEFDDCLVPESAIPSTVAVPQYLGAYIDRIVSSNS
ncbi:XRE family transcriptional regulator [Breznakiellaceae bacterium SP9]